MTFSALGSPPTLDTVRSDDLAEKGCAVPCARNDPSATVIVGCGRAFPGHELRVVDRRGRTLADRRVGEIVLAGPSVMPGYIDTNSLRGHAPRPDWLHSGDLGYLVDREVYVCGRLKDTIIVNGRNYFPQDLEWVVTELTGVRHGRVAAFGCRLSERPIGSSWSSGGWGQRTPMPLRPTCAARSRTRSTCTSMK